MLYINNFIYYLPYRSHICYIYTICFSDTFDFLSLLISQALFQQIRDKEKGEKLCLTQIFIIFCVSYTS